MSPISCCAGIEASLLRNASHQSLVIAHRCQPRPVDSAPLYQHATVRRLLRSHSHTGTAGRTTAAPAPAPMPVVASAVGESASPLGSGQAVGVPVGVAVGTTAIVGSVD